MGLLGGLGKLGGGVLGLNAVKNTPQQQFHDLDDTTKALMARQNLEADKTAEQYANEAVAGIDGEASRLGQNAIDDSAQRSVALGMNTNDLSAALGNRARTKLLDAKEITRLKEKFSGTDKQLKAQEKALGNANFSTSLAAQKQSIALKNKALKKKARGQLFGNVLGIGGAIAGGAIGGVPGAMIGNQAGTALGKGIGEG